MCNSHCGTVLILFAATNVFFVHAQGDFCSSEASDLSADVKIGQAFGHKDAIFDAKAAASKLELVLEKAEQAKDALEAAIAIGKAFRQHLTVPEGSGVANLAGRSLGRETSQQNRIDLQGRPSASFAVLSLQYMIWAIHSFEKCYECSMAQL